MAIPLNLDEYFCPNESCSDHAKKGLGNIVISDRYGRNRRMLLRCKTCNGKFSERRSTFFFGLHTKESTIKEVIRHLLNGMSLREAAEASGLDKDTVHRIWKRFLPYFEESVESFLKEFNIKLEDLIVLLYTRAQKRMK